jgi:hypothetical protein
VKISHQCPMVIFNLMRRILIPFLLDFQPSVYLPFLFRASIWWCYWLTSLLILNLICWNSEYQVCYHGISNKLLWACSTRHKRLRFHGSHNQDKLRWQFEGSFLLMVILLLFWGILLIKFDVTDFEGDWNLLMINSLDSPPTCCGGFVRAPSFVILFGHLLWQCYSN